VSEITTDHNHPGINKVREDGQNEAYIVLSEEERAQGFVRPVRRSYIHDKCGVSTRIHLSIAETFARDPTFYKGGGFCCGCGEHVPSAELKWEDGGIVGQ